MKKIIFGKLYNTETAKLISTYNSNDLPHDINDIVEELYQKKIPISEIAVTLKRNKSAVRARIKKLGITE